MIEGRQSGVKYEGKIEKYKATGNTNPVVEGNLQMKCMFILIFFYKKIIV